MTPKLSRAAGSRRGLLVLASVMLGSIAVAGIGRITGPVSQSGADAKPTMARDLLFADGTDGSVTVRDAQTGDLIATLAPGSNAFLRATMRGFARQRMREDSGPATPFRLTAWSDGRLSLADPATGRSVELEAFGGSNMAVFAALLLPNRAAP